MESLLEITSKHSGGMTIGGTRTSRRKKPPLPPTSTPPPPPPPPPSPIPIVKDHSSDNNSDNVGEVETSSETGVPPIDDSNNEIMEILKDRTGTLDSQDNMLDKVSKRLDFGRKKYGHGIIIEDDTTQYASNWDECSAQNWLMMMFEETLDAAVYASAELIRAKKKDMSKKYITEVERALKHSLKATEYLLNAEKISKCIQ